MCTICSRHISLFLNMNSTYKVDVGGLSRTTINSYISLLSRSLLSVIIFIAHCSYNIELESKNLNKYQG